MKRLWLAAVLAMLQIPEVAALSCDRTDNDRAEASRVISALIGRIDEMEAAIIETLRLQTGQLSGYQAQSTKAIIKALDAQTRLQAQTAREVEETAALKARQPAPRACETVTGLSGLAAAEAAATAAHEDASEMETRRLVSGRSSAADSAFRFRTLTRKHCSRAKNSACSGPDHRDAVDLRIGNLLDRSTIATEEDHLAAIELSRNLAAPVVQDPLPLASAETDQERRRILIGRSADARTALASDYFAHARALRAPAVELGDWAAAIVPRETEESPVSRLELIEILASRRFEDPDWFVHLQSMDQSALLREIVTLQAISLILDWERFRLDERRGAIGAAGLAIANERMRMLPGLSNSGSGAN